MTKNAPRDKKLSLRHETLRNLSADEMGQIQGGFINLICTSVFIPVTGITLTYAIVTGGCD